jgi:hypothetical protein
MTPIPALFSRELMDLRPTERNQPRGTRSHIDLCQILRGEVVNLMREASVRSMRVLRALDDLNRFTPPSGGPFRHPEQQPMRQKTRIARAATFEAKRFL